MAEDTLSAPEQFVVDYEAWLREQTLESLLPRAELVALQSELRDDEALWTEKRPRYDELWAKAEERLRKEERPLRELLSEPSSLRILEAAEGAEPDPEAVRAFLRSPAIEAMLGSILYQGIFEFMKKADLIGRVANKLPIIGGIRRKIVSAFRDEVENRIEGQIKGFLGGFSGMAVERMISFVLSDENRAGFKTARRRLADHMLSRPVNSLMPAPEASLRLRDAVWSAAREASLEDAQEHLETLYADYGGDLLGKWVLKLTPRARALAARPLERFFDEASTPWRLEK